MLGGRVGKQLASVETMELPCRQPPSHLIARCSRSASFHPEVGHHPERGMGPVAAYIARGMNEPNETTAGVSQKGSAFRDERL